MLFHESVENSLLKQTFSQADEKAPKHLVPLLPLNRGRYCEREAVRRVDVTEKAFVKRFNLRCQIDAWLRYK